MEKNVILYGLNRSGTNYLEELIKKHFLARFLNNEDERDHPRHKHFRLYDKKELIGRPNYRNNQYFNTFEGFEKGVSKPETPDLYLVISKDPYSWNISYTNWGSKHKWEESPHPYIMEYNEFYSKWLGFSKETDKVLLLRYIDLLIDSKGVLTSIKDRFNLGLIEPIEDTTEIKKVPMSRRFTSRKKTFYTEQKYMNEYSEEDLAFLNKYIDHELIKKLGYTSYFQNPTQS